MHALIKMTDPDLPRLDLGRPIRRRDIVDKNVQPVDDGCAGYCYCCPPEEPEVTPSTGVFTSLIRCDMDAPVWLCLEHIPHRNGMFDVLTPEVAAELRQLMHQRDEAARAPSQRRAMTERAG